MHRVRHLGRNEGDDRSLQVNGRTEYDPIAVAPKVAGRVAESLVREGDEVRAGQEVLARLERSAGSVGRDPCNQRGPT